jgi:hypothetical protein
MRKVFSGCIVLAAVLFVIAGCGSSSKKTEGEAGKEAQAACTGSPLSSAPKLPPSFPQIEPDKLTYTKQSTVGPTQVVEGYFNGSLQDAHDEFHKELNGAGYQILFDEVDAHDSEVTWKGEGRTGQVALREECGSSDKIYVHITNRPA